MGAFVRRILSCFARGKNSSIEKDNIILDHSSLGQLPTELVSLICSHLSSVDIACLALCCHVLLGKIGTDSLLVVNRESKERRELLTRISQDIPSFYFCHSCYMLHPWANVNMPQTSWHDKHSSCHTWRDLDFLASIMNTNRQTFTTYYFKFVHLQLSMRRYRCGPRYGISTESLSHMEVLRPEHGCGVTILLSVESRVCPGQGNVNEASLHLRVQQWARMPSFYPESTSLVDIVDMRICKHISFKDAYEKYIQSLEAEEKSPGAATDTMYQCHRCLVDFMFQLRNIQTQSDKEAQALVITKWLDLGDGLDPKNPLWQAHRDPYPESQVPHQEVGSVRRRFESEPGLSQQELTMRNEHLMSKERFRQELYRYGRSIWIGRLEQQQ